MDAIGTDLNEPASSISAYTLTGSLETAIRASNAQFDPPYILDKLRVSTQRATGKDEIGWDVFSLRYAVSAPLDVVFTEQSMTKYLRIFTFLWQLKRVEHSLNGTWQTMKPAVTASLERDGASGDAGSLLAQEMRRCHTLRGEMHHFVSNLQYYVMFEVLEGSWDGLTKEMASAQDLDAIVEAHDKYLASVTRKALLGPKSQLLSHTLGGIFDCILRFRGFADRLYDVAKDAAMRRQLARLRVTQRLESASASASAGTTWGSVPGEDAAGGDGLLSVEFVLEMKTQLDAVADDYAKMLDGFLNLLPLQTHVDLRFLRFRLDFSEFYSNKEKGRGGSEGRVVLDRETFPVCMEDVLTSYPLTPGHGSRFKMLGSWQPRAPFFRHWCLFERHPKKTTNPSQDLRAWSRCRSAPARVFHDELSRTRCGGTVAAAWRSGDSSWQSREGWRSGLIKNIVETTEAKSDAKSAASSEAKQQKKTARPFDRSGSANRAASPFREQAGRCSHRAGVIAWSAAFGSRVCIGKARWGEGATNWGRKRNVDSIVRHRCSYPLAGNLRVRHSGVRHRTPCSHRVVCVV